MSAQNQNHPGLAPYSGRLEDLINGLARGRPNAPALSDPEGLWTWAEFANAVDGFARAFAAMGVSNGDRVGFLLSNTRDAYAAMLGAMSAGGIIAPFSTMLSADDVKTLIDDADCKVLVFADAWKELAEAAVEQNSTRILALSNIDTTIECDVPRTDSNADPCNIIYSSGTTGLPKGAVHSHSARVWAAAMCANAFRYRPESVVLLTTPPYTNGSWMVVLPAFFTGAHVCLEPGFNVERFFTQCRTVKPTHAFIVPTQFQMIVDAPGFSPSIFESFHCMITAGAPMPADLKNKILDWAPDSLFELWGLTEVVATVIYPHEILTLRDSVGRALPFSELKLIDTHDREVVLPGSGEIVARSIYQMEGYWNRPKLNQEIQWFDQNGQSFMRTGDIGEIDEDGYLHIRGRVKDMIISGGLNVFPVDIEEVLRGHPRIEDAAVIGVPHKKWGETPVAYVIADDPGIDTGDLIAWANDRLSKFQRLSDAVISVGDFPRNTLGKVLKRELIDDYTSKHSTES